MGGWRGLGLFWAIILLIAGAGGATLALLGPPPAHPVSVAAGAAPGGSGWPGPPPRDAARPIAPPLRLLLEPAPDFPGAMLPRIGPAGRTPGLIYAGGSNPAEARPRIALIIAGIGLDTAQSFAAIAALPPAVDFAVSAYAPHPDALLAAMRRAGHEFLLSLPMEPDGYPSNDEGPHALLTGGEAGDNARNLEWVLSRMQGYAGVTGASDGQAGQRFAASAALFGPVARELAARGLFYIDPRPGASDPGAVAGRAVDVAIELPEETAALDARLAALEQAARDHGRAIGVVLRMKAGSLDRIAAWAGGLDGRGLALVPVSAVLRKAGG